MTHVNSTAKKIVHKSMFNRLEQIVHIPDVGQSFMSFAVHLPYGCKKATHNDIQQMIDTLWLERKKLPHRQQIYEICSGEVLEHFLANIKSPIHVSISSFFTKQWQMTIYKPLQLLPRRLRV
jgi:hypothetical protein